MKAENLERLIKAETRIAELETRIDALRTHLDNASPYSLRADIIAQFLGIELEEEKDDAEDKTT